MIKSISTILITALIVAACGQERRRVEACNVFEVMQRAESGMYISAGYFDSVDVKSRSEAICWADGRNIKVTSREVIVYYLPCDSIRPNPKP